MATREIKTVRELVKELGGPTAASRVLDGTPQLVVHWRKQNRIPAKKFFLHQDILAERGFTAPRALWGMQEAADAA